MQRCGRIRKEEELLPGNEDNAPSHDEIDGQRQDVAPFGRAQAGDENSRDGEPPLEAEDGPACLRFEEHQDAWRVTSCYQKEYAAVVQNLEDTFRTEVRERVVEHGERVEQNQRRAEDGAAGDILRGSDLRGEDAHERQTDDAENDADEMRDAVGPLLPAAAMKLLQTHLEPALMLGAFLFFWGESGIGHF